MKKYCDGCSKGFSGAGKIRRLSLPGNAGVFLCKSCWNKEMRWRKLRNKSLSKSARFPIRKFPGGR